jgi:hypothetical protein
MTLEDNLSNITADLVGLEKNSVFLDRLFSIKMGTWVPVIQLCRGITDVEERLARLQKSFDGTLHVAWLDYPDSVYGQGYCTIIFFSEQLHWNSIALYNKQSFLQKRTPRDGGKGKGRAK